MQKTGSSVTAILPPARIVASGLYYGVNFITTLVTGSSITEHIFDE